MPLKTRKLSHVYSVDGLRALALLAVVIYHMWPQLMPGGYFGVVIFFVIAGFFVSRNFVLEQTEGRYPSLASYYRKRFIRLYLPLLAMVVAVNLFTVGFVQDIYGYAISATPSVLLGFNNIYQANLGTSYFESHGVFRPFTHLWALSLEMQFYLLYPLLIRMLATVFKNNIYKVSRVLWLISIASAIYMAYLFVPGTDPTIVYYSSFARCFSFTVGGAFAFRNIVSLEKISLAAVGGGDFNGPQGQISSLEKRGFYKMGPTPFQSLLALIMLVLLIIPFFCIPYSSNLAFRGGMFLYSILAASFISLSYHDDLFLTPLLAARPLRFLSQRSYSYYVWQYPVTMIFASKLAYSTFSSSLSNIIQLVLLAVLGELSYLFLERGPKQRPYLKTPELAAGIAPLLALATAFMFIIALVVPAPQVVSDRELIKQKIEEAKKEAQEFQAQRSQAQDDSSAARLSSQVTSVAQEGPSENESHQPQEAASQGLSKEKLEQVAHFKVTIIGDSVTDMARADLVKYLPEADLDAKISRQMTEGLRLVKQRAESGTLGDYVIVALGANGDFNSAVLDELLHSVGESKLLLMTAVCPDPFEQSVNNKLRKFAHEHAQEGVSLIDWYSAAKKHREYFYNDATHPKAKGVQVYTHLIVEALLKSASAQ